jgi:hypothetical protein
MSFVARQLSFSVQLGQGDFGGSGFNTVSIPEGLWATARVNKVGSPAYNEADIEIAGLQLSLMNQLSRVGLQPAAVRNNIITVQAGDVGGGLSTVFAGVIAEAWPDFSNEAEPVFKITASTGYFQDLKPVAPTSYKGSTSVVSIMQNLADQMGYKLENNGVSVQLSSPYFPGSARNQAIAAATAAGIYVYFEDDNGIMAICPANMPRNTPVPTISPTTGLVGYPAYVGPGKIAFKCEYNSQLRWRGNATIENSVITGANQTWCVMDLKHDLSTRPGGPWFSVVDSAINLLSGSN